MALDVLFDLLQGKGIKKEKSEKDHPIQEGLGAIAAVAGLALGLPSTVKAAEDFMAKKGSEQKTEVASTKVALHEDLVEKSRDLA